MYCPSCECEFQGWIGKCPNCETQLIREPPSIEEKSTQSISYQALLDLLRESGGQIGIGVSTTAVGVRKKRGFPCFGYRFAWMKRMQGDFQGFSADLTTTDVGIDKRWSFPYFGYGYAWGRTMQGFIGGNEATLVATKVSKKKRKRFPYFGYGYAWVEELLGDCGEKISLRLLTTEVGKKTGRGFPYLGYGSAWANKGILTLMLVE